MNMIMNYMDGKYQSPITYASKHKNDDVRIESRSGGVFTALSDYVLECAGVVYGCALNEDFKAVHIRAENRLERDRMRGSKYTQSLLSDSFKAVKKDLEDGRIVLFSGTSCQVAGLQGFLGKKHPNLILVDIVCHGVPSPMVWADYLKWQEKKHKSKIRQVDFRNKKDYGWKEHIETLLFENGQKEDSRVYSSLFYGLCIVRPSCFKCPYKDKIHPGNITLADYWGIDEVLPDFNDNKGVSLVLINDEKGKNIFDVVSKNLYFVETIMSGNLQKPLVEPYNEPVNRAEFWRYYHKRSFGCVVRNTLGNSYLVRFQNKIKQLLRSLKRK